MANAPQNPAAAEAVARGLVDPTPSLEESALMAAPRLATLKGKTVGLLDNRKGNGDRLLAHIGTLLQERYGVEATHSTTKFVYARRATEEILDDLAANSDFVVTAIGD